MGWWAGEVCGPPNIRLLPLEGAPRSSEDRPLRSKGAANRRHFTHESHQALSGPRLFYEKPAILRRLRRHLLPKEGGFGTPSSSICDTKDMHVTLTIYSSPQAIPPPFEPSEPFEPILLWCLRHHLPPASGGTIVWGDSLLNPGREAAQRR